MTTLIVVTSLTHLTAWWPELIAGVAATAGDLYIVLTTGDADRPPGVPFVVILLRIGGPALLGVA